ncbi:MAG: hypothetical protein ABIT76_11295 [Chthoniobacterales bacterium]
MSATPPDSRRVISSGASKREIILAVLGALLVIALVGFAVMKLGNNSSETAITGQVVAKKFVPRPETQVTIGGGGVQRNDQAGLYYLSVKARDTQEIYSVLLSEEDYNRVKIGDTYQIPKASLVP